MYLLIEQTMENNNKKDKPESLKDWLVISLGFILVLLAVIGGTGKTFIGEFFTYSSAYLFGVLYPLVFVFMVILGIRLIYSKKAFPIKGYGLFWVGLFLILLNVLAFGSYPFILEDKTLNFTQLNDFYSDRVLAFARYPFNIDNYQSLSGLGGGYIGTLLVTLFGSMWGYIGDAVFFSIMLLLGLFFVCFKPAKNAIIEAKVEKNQKVGYSSPYQKKNGKRINNGNQDDEIPTPIKRDPSLTDPFPTDWSKDYAVSDKDKTKALSPEEEQLAKRNSESQGGFSSTMTFSAVPEARDRPLVDQDNERKITNYSSQPEEKKPADPIVSIPTVVATKPTIAPAFTPASNSSSSNQQPDTPYQRKTISTPLNEEEENFDNLSEEDDLKASDLAKAFKNNSQAKDSSTFEVEKPDPAINYEKEQATVASQPYVNPLKRQAEEVSSSPFRETKPQEFSVESEQKEAEKPTAPVETEEEKEARLEQEYFIQKQKNEQAEILKKEQAEKKRLDSMMKYVTDKPKNYTYKLPDDSLLNDIDDSDKLAVNSESAQEKAKTINKVFDDFGVGAKAISFTIGASVTRFNIQTDPGVKSEKITSLVNEFQRALGGDKSVRIETVVEGKTTSGIEVGNAAPMAVPFKEAFRVIEQNSNDNLLLPIGKDISGKIVTFPLNDMPHLLVAGTTGSGKSVLVNCMIMTLIMRNYPSQLKLMLIDPKQVEFAKYAMEPHLFCPVISDSGAAINGLKKLCDEMDRRYTVLKNWSCVKISEYRSKRVGREDQMEELPDIVCVIDEFAELMQTSEDEVASYVQRLTQKARAAGIYLIIATQRPDKHVIPMVIKANIVCRIGLSCSSQVDSRVILDENGTETLLGKGDLLFKCPGKKALIRAQSPFISNLDMDKVLDYVKKNAGNPCYNPGFLDLEVKSDDPSNGEAPNSEDLYLEMKEFVMKTGIVSKSKLMRNFSLSYSKVDSYLVRLLQDGIIMQVQGGKYAVTKRLPMED